MHSQGQPFGESMNKILFGRSVHPQRQPVCTKRTAGTSLSRTAALKFLADNSLTGPPVRETRELKA